MLRRRMALALALVLTLALGSVALANGNPVVYDNWTSGDAAFECSQIGTYDYGLKVGGAPNDSWLAFGNTITISGSDGKVFNWSATDPIGAVIVKAGTGANVWFYDPQVAGDSGLYAYQNKDVSHTTFCWNLEAVENLQVSKTAKTSYIRTHDWSIDKSVGTDNDYMHEEFPKIWLYIDGSGNESAEWTVDVTYEGYDDSDFNVSGEITIKNTGTLDAVITSVDDVLGGATIDVTCGVAFPYTLGGGNTLTCSYNEDVARKITGKNTVDVTTEVDTYSAEADVTWGEPDSEVNASITIKDVSDLFGEVTLGTVDAPNGAQFTYIKAFAWGDYGQDLGGDYIYDNTATIVETKQSASATLKVNVQSYIYETAYALGGGPCFIDEGFSNWGWTNPIGIGTYTWDLWAGAGRCDTSKGTLVGSVTVSYNGSLNVTYNVSSPYLLDETHVYAGEDMFPLDRRGNPTVAPGQYYTDSPFNWVIAHAVVGIPDPDFGP